MMACDWVGTDFYLTVVVSMYHEHVLFPNNYNAKRKCFFFFLIVKQINLISQNNTIILYIILN